jgi:hypothetical protein
MRCWRWRAGQPGCAARRQRPYGADYAALTATEKESLRKLIIQQLTEQLTSGQRGDAAGALLSGLIESTVKDFFDTLTDPDFILNMVLGAPDASIGNLFSQLALKGKVAAAAIQEAIVLSLAQKFGNPGELDGIGCLISTSAISGVGAANVGVAGSAAIAVVDGETEALIESRTGYVDGDIAVTEDAAIRARAAQKVYTTATASADKNGKPVKNKDDSSGTSVGVGASAAISIVDVDAIASLGSYRRLSAGTLAILSEARNDIDSVTIAGADPIARREAVKVTPPGIGQEVSQPAANNTTTKDISVDAAVALAVITNNVLAQVLEHASVTTTGHDTVKTGVADGAGVEEMVNFLLSAYQRGQTKASASGFAVAGDKAAVGAAIAVNIAMSDVRATFAGVGLVAGSAKITALTSNEDEANALATVVGASLDRYFDRLRTALRLGSVGSGGGSGKMNATIVNKINGFLPKAKELTANVPFSAKLFDLLGVKTPAAPSSSTASGAATGNAGGNANSQSLDDSAKKEQSINLAAALGVNVTNHCATAEMTGSLTAKNAEISAADRSNFRTTGSGATVTLPSQQNANNIALGIAVTVNRNKAHSTVGGSLTATGSGSNNGAVRVTSAATQNMDGAYRGLLGAQAVACAIAGSGGKVGLAGAVAVMVAGAESIARIAEGALVRGGAISILATDQSTLAVRAGSVSATGASAGVGASFALIYAESLTRATIGKNAQVYGGSLKLSAEKLRVDSTDYQFPLGISTLFTVDASADRSGIVNLKTSGGYALELNLGMDDVMKTLDMLNFLASVNYYVEAIAGSVVGSSDAKLALAGSVAMLFTNNETAAEVGDGAVIVLTDGSLDVDASSDTVARLIGGAVAATTGKSGVGVNIAALADEDMVRASIGAGAKLGASGDVTVDAAAASDTWAVTVAAGVSTGSGPSIGGSINMIVSGNTVWAGALGAEGDTAGGEEITAGGDVRISADNVAKMTLISASLGAGSGVAAGGTAAVIVTNNDTRAALGAGAKLTAGRSAAISARSAETMLNISGLPLRQHRQGGGGGHAGRHGIPVADTGLRWGAGAGDRGGRRRAGDRRRRRAGDRRRRRDPGGGDGGGLR